MKTKILLESQDYIEPEMIDAAINFWFNDQGEIRSPFPDYIKSELKDIAVEKFLNWSKKLSPQAKKQINDEILAERFEEFLFEEATKLVMSDEERLTIKFPFMLRLGDQVKHGGKPKSEVIARQETKEGEKPVFKVSLREIESGAIWETSFELPAE